MGTHAIKALFLDIGGVLLTNGWDRQARKRAAETFNLDEEEMNSRHSLTFDTYEIGKITLEDYLNRVIFYRPRSFTVEQFKEFMFKQSQPYPAMIELIKEFKEHYQLKAVALSNEGRELTDYRMRTFQLKEFIDIFVFSAFVHLRKPDLDIYQLALDVAQVEPQEVIYIDDRPLLVELANQLGMNGIHHTNREITEAALAKLMD